VQVLALKASDSSITATHVADPDTTLSNCVKSTKTL
jgi:hypothetical protein